MALRYFAGWDHANIGAATMTTSGIVASVNISSGTYCHADASDIMGTGEYTDFATALDTALGGTFSVSFNASTLLYTISAGSAFQITAMNLLMKRLLGFDILDASLPTASASSVVGTQKAWYAIAPTVEARSDVSDDFEPGQLGADGEADDASFVGVSRTSSPVYHDWVQMMEPKSACYTRSSTYWTNMGSSTVTSGGNGPTRVWTYEQMFKHARNVSPIYVYDSEAGVGTDDMIAQLRAEGSSWRPERVSANSDVSWNVPFKARVYSTSDGVTRL